MELFYKNLEKYKVYEVEASKRIQLKNNVDINNYCNNNKYDFKTSDNKTYEVKTEPMSLTTNNIFLEFFAYGKPSGISTTESNFYIFCDTKNYFMIDTLKVKELIKNNTFKIITTKDKLTFGYLIKKEIIVKHSVII